MIFFLKKDTWHRDRKRWVRELDKWKHDDYSLGNALRKWLHCALPPQKVHLSFKGAS